MKLTLDNLDVVAAAAKETNYGTIWRTSLGIGVVFPMFLFYLRLKLKEPENFQTENMKKKTPYKLVLKYYWPRLMCVSWIWFIYNVSSRLSCRGESTY
jgi:hypothetical protein